MKQICHSLTGNLHLDLNITGSAKNLDSLTDENR